MTEHNAETGEILSPAIRPPQAIVPLASAACAQVWTALAEAQGRFETPKRTKEATIEGESKGGKAYSFKYHYAPLEEIERVIKTPLAELGLYRQQYLVSRSEQWFIRTVIGHKSGEWIACDYPIFASKPGAQGFASGVTYARRYGLSLALGLCPEDDDDAQLADINSSVTPAKAGGGEDKPADENAPAGRTEARRRAKIDPAVATPSPEKDAPRAAYKRLSEAIARGGNSRDVLTAIYDETALFNGEEPWGVYYRDDAKIVAALGPQYLDPLIKMIAARLAPERQGVAPE